ncbi:hypothetical protein AGMMS49965_18300 [Bacteroidia bacterium]|nr:hypothetical protein AGMMS49965_18300 [Bacteroidia bacterium]
MKKIYLFIACSVLLFGCSDDLTNVEEFNSEPVEKVPTSRIVSSPQAKVFAEKAIGAIQESGDTVVIQNSVLRSVEEVIPLESSNGETALYIVNFAENHGFMVLSADKEAPNPMLVFDTEGTFDIEKIANEGAAVWTWLEMEKGKISENIKSGIHSDNQGYQLWEYIVGSEDGETNLEIASADEMNAVKTQLRGTHANSSGRSSIAPWYNVRYNLWGQGTGYNANAAISGAPVGCPAVAIGLLCKTHNYPSTYSYSSMPTSLNTSSPNAISTMFRDIANKIPEYTWNYYGSGATPANILTGLKNLGYRQAKLKIYDAWTAYSNIKDWYPILLGATQYASGGSGHIWIADGYYEQTWKYTSTKKFLGITYSTSTWYEYMDTFYMNWGWNGSGNGWVDQEDWSSGGYNYNRNLYYDLYPY